MKKTKVLFIVNYFFGDSSGAVSVARTHYNVLREAYGKECLYTMALVGTQKYNEQTEDSLFSIENVSGNSLKRIKNLLFGNTGKMDEDIIERIKIKVKENDVDIIFFDDSIYGNAIRKIRKIFPKIRVIAYYHDVKRNLCKEWIKKEPLKLPIYMSLMLNEYWTQKYADYNLILNKREARVYTKYYKKSPEVIFPVVLPAPVIKRSDTVLSEELNILFVGGYYYPNVNGIDWFIKNVFSALKGKRKLTIVGNNMERLQEKYADKEGISVSGRVEDLTSFYMEADIIIGPIFEGAGMKVKTAEAFSYGKCFIGTDESLEGYKELIVSESLKRYIHTCNSAHEFQQSLEYFRKHRLEFQKTNEIVRNFFEENYSVGYAVNLLHNLIDTE